MGKSVSDYSPDNHSPDICPAFSIRHPPSWLWLRLAALDCNSGGIDPIPTDSYRKERRDKDLCCFFFAICAFFVVNSSWLRRAALGLMRILRQIIGSAFP